MRRAARGCSGDFLAQGVSTLTQQLATATTTNIRVKSLPADSYAACWPCCFDCCGSDKRSTQQCKLPEMPIGLILLHHSIVLDCSRTTTLHEVHAVTGITFPQDKLHVLQIDDVHHSRKLGHFLLSETREQRGPHQKIDELYTSLYGFLILCSPLRFFLSRSFMCGSLFRSSLLHSSLPLNVLSCGLLFGHLRRRLPCKLLCSLPCDFLLCSIFSR